MAAAHEAWVEEMFRGLDQDDRSQLMAILTRLRRTLVTERPG
jgi:hypothetical protein